MEEKKINKSVVFSIVAVLLLVMVVAGSTFAYFRAAGETDVQEITTADLGINFVDGELLNAKLQPILREDMLTKAAKKTFTITNTGEEKLFVHISMEDIVLPEALKRFDFMWSLYEGDKNVSNGTFADATSTYIEVGPYQVFEKGASKTYNLYVWVEETSLDQNLMMGQIFNTKIKAVGETYHTSPESDFEIDENGVIIAYDGTGGDVIIPETIGEVTVTSIAHSAFSSCDLTNVVIPNSVTEIGEAAFNRNYLTSVTIPNSVTSIDEHVFQKNELTSIVIPNSVTSIGYRAFSNNYLTNVVIPNSVASIGDNAFEYNELTNVIIPNSVTSIGASAFSDNPLTNVIIQRPSADGITLGENWSGTCPTENIIYNSNY